MADETLEVLFIGKDEVTGVAKKIGTGIQSGMKFAIAGAGAAVAAVGALGAGMVALAADAEPLIGLQQGFAATTDRMGVSTDEFLAKLQDMSGGMITNRDLMESVNKGAALVGTEFASTLPDAMGLVQKAALSTGQDFGFLMDSLVTGVGRVSPMILDNLGIQVQLSQVTERASEMFGKQASELSKTEQQMALNEIVLEKLNDAYGNVPDVAQPMAKIRTSFTNIKDAVGVALAQGLSPLFEKFAGLIDDIGPRVVEFFEGPFSDALSRGIEFLSIIGETVMKFIGNLQEGMSPIDAFLEAIWDIAPPELLATIVDFRDNILPGLIEKFTEIKDKVIEMATPIIEWVQNFVSAKDILIALGIAIAITVIPIIVSLIGTIISIAAPIIAIIAVVAFLRNVWENDFLGIRTALENFWNQYGKPIFETIKAWLEVHIPIAIEILKRFWETVLLPAIQNVWNWLSTVLIPFFQNVVFPWLAEHIPEAIETLKTFWLETLLPAIQDVWNFIQNDLVPLFETLWDLLETVGGLVLTALAGFWENVLQPALQTVWDFISANIIPIFEDLWALIKETLEPALDTLAGFFDGVSESVGGISGAIQTVIGWINDFIDKIASVELPWWLTPGSPTPFEIGLVGIAGAMRNVSFETGRLGSNFAHSLPATTVPATVGRTNTTNNTYNLTVVTGASASDIISTFQLMESMAVE